MNLHTIAVNLLTTPTFLLPYSNITMISWGTVKELHLYCRLHPKSLTTFLPQPVLCHSLLTCHVLIFWVFLFFFGFSVFVCDCFFSLLPVCLSSELDSYFHQLLSLILFAFPSCSLPFCPHLCGVLYAPFILLSNYVCCSLYPHPYDKPDGYTGRWME